MNMKMKNKKMLVVISATLLTSLLFSCNKGGEKPNISSSDSVVSESISTNSESSSVEAESVLEKLMKKYNAITLERAIELSGTTKDVYTEEKYYIVGKISQIANPTWGNLTITDGKNSYEIYGSYNEDGTIRYDAMESKPVIDDYVVYYGTLGYFKAPQMKDASIIEFVHETSTVSDEYTQKTCLEARNLEAGQKVKITGVVAQITYADGMIPNGFYVVDDTSSIYVFGKNTTAQVKVGNKVTVAGSKTYFISETEQGDAAKFNYKGCCQIEEATLLENDNGTHDFSTSWIKEKTVKEIMTTPYSENVTTDIYKVNAIIKRAQCDGFVNYYIDDLDGTTGSYVYTACNGSDFSWLDQYDGKLCTLYVSPINAKSTASGCVYRLMPIKVISDDYKFDLTKTNEFIYEYYIKDVIKSTYKANPELELITKYSNEQLGITNATISYASSNEDAIYFDLSNQDKAILNVKNEGNADVTITINYGETTLTKTINVAYEVQKEVASVNVKTAIDTADGEIVTVKGVVASGLTNQNGFYLIDETGTIAVKMDKETLKEVHIGDLVVVKGTRTHFSPSDKAIGQSCILDATLENNFYGDHQYSTASFKNDLTVAEMVNLSTLKDYSTSVYTLTGKIVKYVSTYATTYEILDADGKTYIPFYAANGGQYEWLEPYVDKEVTIEMALCNWNKQTKYKGCVIAVIDGDTRVVNLGSLSE